MLLYYSLRNFNVLVMKVKLIILTLLLFLSNFLAAQNTSSNLNDLLSLFYSEVSNQNTKKALRLSKQIDSILLVGKALDKDASINYLNAKGFVYYLNELNPEPYLTKADSLNNSLANPREFITIYSSYFLGDYYYNRKEYLKAKKAYSKIIDFKNISKEFNSYKSEVLEEVFLMERIELNTQTDSTQVKNTAKKLIEFKKKINDTLNISYANALNFEKRGNDAEKVFLSISNIQQTDTKFNKYDKFQALTSLNHYYYIHIKESSNARKQIEVSERLLSVVENTDYLELHNIYAVYGDILIASILLEDDNRVKIYESKILDLLSDSTFPNSIELNLNRFYYTLHKIEMYFEIDKNYEKAKFYAYKNVELTKHLYGEVSIEHEQELRSYENIIKLKMFDYDLAYQVSLKREKIIRLLFTEESTEYLEVLLQQYHIFLTEFKYEKGLEIIKKALIISKKINCDDEKLCNDTFFKYIDSLNYNKLYKRALEETFDIENTKGYISLFKLSNARRYSYYGLKNYLGVNFEFERFLDEIENNEKDLLSDPVSKIEFRVFLLDYQEHLRSTGRLDKALKFTKKYLILFENSKYLGDANNFRLNYLNILFTMGKCSLALKFIENNEVLKFDEITTTSSKLKDQNNLQFILSNVYNCLGDNIKAIDSYEKNLNVESNYQMIYMGLSRLYRSIGDKKNSRKYLTLFEKEIKNKKLLDLYMLALIVDLYIFLEDEKKIIEYLLPLSEKTIEDICSKSFYSYKDNELDKNNHEWIISNLLTLNNSELYDSQLSANTVLISNLYKKKIDFYGEVNLGIQKLEKNKNADAITLKKLKEQFNKSPTGLLSDEINQLISKIIGSRIVEYDDLCNIDINAILNTINENEIVADLTTYNQSNNKVETYAINFHYYHKSATLSQVFLDKDEILKTTKILESTFYENLLNVMSKKIGSDSDKIDTFYIIPSGKSNLINFSALSLHLEERLGRKIKVHVINSLSDIPKIKKEEEKNIEDLILIGDIDYNRITNNSSKNKENLIRGKQLTNSIEESGIPLWGYLPGTKQEIESIERIALANNINTLILSEKKVKESNLNKVILDPNKNNVFHIATHGYFFPDTNETDTDNLFASHQNPLLRSGLILSGANENWNNKTLVESNNDGILTAEEISFMDLSSVELVVLSACDTGLGDVSNLEGISGLQRAFKLAGANKLIMSLWKVPDKETAEFFKYFYKFLLQDKISINESFRRTQKIMNEKYDPYYWASFILLE